MEELAIRSQIESQERQAAAEKEVYYYNFKFISSINNVHISYRLFDKKL